MYLVPVRNCFVGIWILMSEISNIFRLDILTAFSLITLYAHTIYTRRKLREVLNLLCKSKSYLIRRSFFLKNLLKFYLITIVAEPEEPEEFTYDYDPKQDNDEEEFLK